MTPLLFEKEVYAIMGAMMEVHSELGCGFYEGVYQEAGEIELGSRGIPFAPQMPLEVRYKGKVLEKRYIADFVCFGEIIVEIKSLDELTSREEAQLLNYLKATGHRVGLLVNFGSRGKLEWRRMVR